MPNCTSMLSLKIFATFLQSVMFAVAEDRFEPRPGRVHLLKKNYFK